MLFPLNGLSHTSLEGNRLLQVGITSSPGLVTCGVSQGSILGPLLFLCYVNNMVTSVSADCKLILYADDSAIMFAHKNH